MAVGDIYRLSCVWERAASQDNAVNVFHFRQGDPPIFDTPAEDLVGAFVEEVELAYSNCVNPGYALTKYTVRQVTGGLEIFEQSTNIPGNVGSATTQLAAQVAGIVSWRSGLAGRSRRGRTYLPPADELEISSGLWIDDYITRESSFVNTMINLMNVSTITHAAWELVIWSTVLALATPVTGVVLPRTPATQRKRRLGVGS